MEVVIGIEGTAHTFGVGISSLDGEILLDFSDQYKPPGGGIHPREAAEHHSKVAPNLIDKAFNAIKENEWDIIAVGFSMGPGLGPCLRVAATVARSLSLYMNAPLYGVHHGVAHIEIGKKLTGASDPLTLLVSGGHSMIVALENHFYRVFGETLDISIGNLIDMFMREAGYPSPAGELCEKLAEKSQEFIDLPYVVKGTDLSFSGILTKAKKLLKKGVSIETICKSLQEVAFAMLTEVTERALAHTKKKELMIVGGVANNARLRSMLKYIADEHEAKFYYLDKFNGDNAAMIAWLTALYVKYGEPISVDESFVKPLWRLDSVYIPWS
ncbi:MAG: KEOPS complex N(6)-L-threonylcarbamoyladenine synthase Kae1 [Candidatus Njordarchaeia archaeon]